MNYNSKEIALSAAAAGLYVLPTHPDTKKPLITDWPNKASTDPLEIERLWGLYPNAIIGVKTGKESKLFIVDIDVTEGECPFAILSDFETQYGPIPEGAMYVRTPSGGLHIYLRMPEDDLRNSAKAIFRNVDIRANGGYVIFAGSVRSDGKAYQVIDIKERNND